MVNIVKAGSAVPLKFSVGGYRGLDIFAAGYPASARLRHLRAGTDAARGDGDARSPRS